MQCLLIQIVAAHRLGIPHTDSVVAGQGSCQSIAMPSTPRRRNRCCSRVHGMRGGGVGIDWTMAPLWVRTGYRFFPFAAEVGDVWWVLRFNVGFPEHDLFTVFVGNRAAADVTGDPKSVVPLIASIGSLSPVSSQGAELDTETARALVGEVARFVEYGSEDGQPCVFCSHERDGLTRNK